MTFRHLAGAGRFAVFVSLLLLTSTSLAGLPYQEPRRTGPPPADAKGPWAEMDRLLWDQKMKEALEIAEKLLAEARGKDGKDNKDGKDGEWTRALVRTVQLRMSVTSFEEGLATLAKEPWPSSPEQRAVLHLFRAEALRLYFGRFYWEIAQRERVDTQGPASLELWTRDEVFAAILAGYAEVWKERERLGEVSAAGLSDFLDPGTYPAEVRGTVRDVVSYQLAGLLADRRSWSPRQENEVYRLGLPRLLEESGELSAEPERLLDLKVHPLERLAAVLADLEAWHRSGDRRAGELEARLERVRQLLSAFSREEDRLALRRHLEEILPAWRDVPWWAMGMAELAESFRQELEHDPEALVRAHAAAREGREAYPDSPGGQRCAAIVREIEAPEYRIESMSSDGLARRSIRVSHKNLPALYFRAYRVEGGGLQEEPPKLTDLLGRKPVASWQADLAPTPDFREHATYVTPALDRKGDYRILVSTGEGFERAKDRIESFNLTLGDLVLVSRFVDPQAPTAVEVLALSGPSGEPVAGAEVQLFLRGERGELRAGPAGKSGREGTARLSLPSNQGGVLRGRLRDDATWVQGIYGYDPGPREEPAAASLVYTDRSAYRPLQKVFWKVLAFRPAKGSEGGRFDSLPGAEIKVRLLDPNGEAVAETTVTTGEYGTASGEMTIPAGRRLGYWRIETSAGGGSAMFRVEEYKRPTFEVEMEDPAEPLRLNRPAVLTGRARYYFGLPVSGGDVRWKVERRPLYFWWWGGGGPGGSEVVASGSSSLGADGTFRIELTPAADEREAQGEDRFAISYLYHVTADVTDEGRETRTGQRGFRLGWTSVEARVAADAGFFRGGQPAALTVTRANLDGQPRPGEGKWTLAELAQPSAAAMPADLPYVPARGYRTPGDDLAPRWNTGYEVERVLASWPDGREVAGGEVQHGADGEARVVLPADLPPGAYRLRYETVDDFGAPYKTARDLIVASEAGPTPLALAAVLRVEEATVPVGGTARVLAHSGLPGQPLFLEVYRAGKLSERRRLTAGESPAVIEFPIRREDRGGFGLRLLVLRDHQLVQLEDSVRVPWDDRQLEVELSSFRDKVAPGGRETWKVSVRKGTEGSPEVGAAEVLAYMYDRSLDVFNAHQPPDLLGLYPDRRGVAHLQLSLGQVYPQPLAWEGWPPRHPPVPGFVAGRFRLFDGWTLAGPASARVLKYVQPFLEKVQHESLERQAAGTVAQFATAAASPVAIPESQAMDRAANQAAPPPPPPPPAPAQPQPSPAAEVRRDFAETAFWFPHLLTGPDGSASLEFTVPDSLTSWNVWVHAVTRDLRAGSTRREVRSAKDLMVRPYLPRFLREGDRAELKVAVDNASAAPLAGEVTFDILDPETGVSRLADFGLAGDTAGAARRPFTAEAGAGTSVTFPVTVPRGVGEVHFRVTAVTAAGGGLSDGELRPLPVLPSRLRLAQSRFAAVRNGESRTLRFEDLEKGTDPTRENEQLVVTLDGQLFYGVLAAVPYLVNYPYECTEQTLNRFLSTGIVTSLFDRYPAVAKMGAELSKRDTVYETWDQVDPNRKIALEETPWLDLAQGGKTDLDLVRVLDPRIAKAERESALDKLEKAQLGDGAFPWWPGGPASPGMTLYLLHGFAKAVEHGVEVPKPMVAQAWRYLGQHYKSQYAGRLGNDKEHSWEFLTFLNYVATAFPDDSWTGGALPEAEQQRILDASLRNWRSHSPYLQAMLALTLKRKGREESAQRVFASLLDAAKTTTEEGTFWEPQARPWLWHDDSVEGHAFILRALMEIAPEDPRRHGLVQWLFLNKKLNHWKSTRATAEALYALVHYLDKEGQLGAREAVKVRVGTREESFVFEPDRYTGKKNQVVVPGDQIEPARSAVTVDPETSGLLFASATWHYSTEELPKAESGDLFGVSRRYFQRVREGDEMVLRPLADGAVLQAGDEVEVVLVLKSRAPAEYVHLRDPRPAGFEPGAARSGFRWGQGLAYYEEVRDSGTNFFVERLPAGEYTLRYRVRANVAGTFRSGPATLQSMYAPEFTAYSAGEVVKVEGK